MPFGMMIELDKCVGCQACVTSCKERWDSGPGAARDWVFEHERGTRATGLELTFYPGLCMQCEAHPCTLDCPTGATYPNEHGVVVVDRDVCIGCGNCIPMCPYGARHADPRQGIVEKCNFCAPYVARGEAPACVATCLAECRTFGELDDPSGPLVQLIAQRAAKPLVTADVQTGPRVYYAPDRQRQHVLDSGVVRQPTSTWLTHVWRGYTRPAAQVGVPAMAVAAALGGLFVNFRNRGHGEPAAAAHTAAAPDPGARASRPPFLRRHSVGMRVLHWFNAASWVALLLSGTALMATAGFALFGTRLPELGAAAVGGRANLLLGHVVWGLVWALVIVPGFLYQKRGGIEALREVWLTGDDLYWLAYKPLAMLGFGPRKLPPQDKYNAGQKLFAIAVLVATTLIIGSGLVMSFHLGSAETVAAAILAHKLAIMLVLLGLGVHLTMAVIMRDERPALRSMLKGDIAYEHAAAHAEKWVEEIAGAASPHPDGTPEPEQPAEDCDVEAR